MEKDKQHILRSPIIDTNDTAVFHTNSSLLKKI